MGLLVQVVMWIVSDKTAKLAELIPIWNFRYVSSLSIHITTCVLKIPLEPMHCGKYLRSSLPLTCIQLV